MAGQMNIGAGIRLDGEKEFKSAVAAINKDIKVLGSEMAKVTAQFGSNANSMEANRAKADVLSKQYDTQKKKVETLRTALENSAKEFGENSNRTKDWQIQLNRAEAELYNLEKNTEENNKELATAGKRFKEAGDSAEKSGPKFERLGGILKGVGAAMGGAAIAAGAAALKLGKEVVKQFSELEQNLGGSEAVFGKYAENIQKIGEDAYKNLGVSQSQYLQTANKMGALFQGSGLEQEKAMELTTKAMQRAADVASVMGIDMQAALDSIAGAAKGNFTMMDNLGVSMNATNLEAYALSKGLNFTWKTATQAEKAEVAMQMFFERTEQYAGNFARESTQTVSGSIGMLKSALTSFVGGLGNANADMTNLTKNLVDAFKAVVKNIVPVVKNIVKALPDAIGGILPEIGKLLPDLLQATTDLFKKVLEALLGMLPQLVPVVVEALMTITRTLIDNLPLLITTATSIIMALIQGLTQALPQLIPAAVSAILTVVEGIVDNLPMLIDAAIELVMALTDGIINALPVLLEKAPEIIKKLVEGITGAVPQLVDAAIQVIMSLVDFLLDPKNLAMLIKAALEIVLAIAGGLIKAKVELMKAIPKLIGEMIKKFKETDWGEIGRSILKGIGEGLLSGVKGIINTVKDVAGNIASGFKSFFGIKSPSKLFKELIGENLALGIGEGFTGKMKAVTKQMTDAVPTDFNASVNTSSPGYGGSVAFTVPIYIDGVLQQTEKIILTASGLMRAASMRTVEVGS